MNFTKRRILWMTFGLILLPIIAAGCVIWRGGWINALGIQPARDESTPAIQNGFVLLSVQGSEALTDIYGGSVQCFRYKKALQAGAGAAGLWIRPPNLPESIVDNLAGVENEQGVNFTTSEMNGRDSHGRWVIPNGQFFHISAHASTGDTFPLYWAVYKDGNDDPVMLVVIPPGYSRACDYVDVTISDAQGHTARWRIVDLPACATPSRRQSLRQPLKSKTASPCRHERGTNGQARMSTSATACGQSCPRTRTSGTSP